MQIKAVRSKKIIRIKDDLKKTLISHLKLKDGDIVAVTSKVVSLCEGSVVTKREKISKDDLTIKAAERYIPRNKVPGHLAIPTVKNHALVVAAGIDDFDDSFVLWPRDPDRSAKKLQLALRKKFKIRKLGLIITDSHSMPLRRGSIGFALGYFGFKPLRSYLGKTHLTGRTMRVTRANLVDGLATSAVLAMGEGGEQTPFAIIRGAKSIEFTNKKYAPRTKHDKFKIPIAEDIFRAILDAKVWKKKKRPNRR